MRLRTLPKTSLKGKKILLRVDVNAALHNGKTPIDSPRFEAHGRTIKKLSERSAKIVILAHQGRRGSSDFVSNLSKHAKLLEKHSGKRIKYINGLFDKKALDEIAKMKNHEIIMLRNVRDYPDEMNVKSKKNRYRKFSKNFDIYVNDAFSICHRSQGSIVIPPRIIPGYAGPVLRKEFESLKKFKLRGKTLFVLGGAKVKEFTSLKRIMPKENVKIAAGGIIGNLVLYDDGISMGYENKLLKKIGCISLKINSMIRKYRKRIYAPLDFAIDEKNRRKEILLEDVPVDKRIMDIGKNTIGIFSEQVQSADTIIMKGPLGVSELPRFSQGTVEIMKEVSKRTKRGAKSLVSGGNLTTAIDQYNIKRHFSYISLSGGAMIEFICGEKLPGLEALKR